MNTTFSISEVYKTAWDYTKKNIVFLLVSTFVFFVLSVILSNITKDGGIFGIFGIVSIYLYVIFHIGLINMGIIISKGNIPDIDNFKIDWLIFWRFVLAGIITLFFVILGTIVFIIPGIIIAVRLSLTSFLIIDRKYSFWSAIKESYKITKGHSFSIFGLCVLNFIVAIVALIPSGLGLILATPFFGIVYVVMSQRVLSMKKQELSKEVTPAPAVSGKASQVPLVVETQAEIEAEKEEIIKGVKEIGEKYKVSDEPEFLKKTEPIEKPKTEEVEKIEIETEKVADEETNNDLEEEEWDKEDF